MKQKAQTCLFLSVCAALTSLVLSVLPVRCDTGVQVYDDERAADALKVLFIGNSYTFANDMPKIFASLVRSANSNKSLKVYMAAFPSYTLDEHIQDHRTVQALEREGPWDFVVLQERSYYPLTQAAQMETACLELDRKIRAVGARTVLLETWADENAPQAQEAINGVYRKIARRLNATVIAAGEAWPAATKAGRLYSEDGHHPSVAGSFLVACAAYKALVGKDPRNLPTETESSLAVPLGFARQIKQCVSTATEASAANVRGGAAGANADRHNSGGSARNSAAPGQSKGVQTFRW